MEIKNLSLASFDLSAHIASGLISWESWLFDVVPLWTSADFAATMNYMKRQRNLCLGTVYKNATYLS